MGSDELKNEEGKLEKLQKRLYKEGAIFKQRFEREPLPPSEEDVRTYWKNAEKKSSPKNLREMLTEEPEQKKSGNNLLYILSATVFVILAAGSFFIYWQFFKKANVVSSKNIEIVVEGSASINAGSFTKWRVVLTNRNQIGLDLADLVIDYPEYTISEKNAEISRERIAIGKINPGQTIAKEFGAFILGRQNQDKTINLTLEYRPEGSSGIFAKTFDYKLRLAKSAIGLSLGAPKEMESGQKITIEAEVVSNAEVILRDIWLGIEYPPGFHYLDSELKPEKGDNVWRIGDLSPNEKRHFSITGVLEGQDLTDLAFKAVVGKTEKTGDAISEMNSTIALVLLKRPFLNFSFKTQSGDISTVMPGEYVSVLVPWKNNLPVEVRNVTISVKLIGDSIDRRTISANKGFYRSDDNSVVWTPSSLVQLRSISPGGIGTALFAFKIFDSLPVKSENDKNFTITLQGMIDGSKIEESGQATAVRSSISKEVKITTKAQLVAKALYKSGPFQNTGPLPPKVGQETTFAIVWSLSNFYNDLSGIVVKSSLPSYMRWLGTIAPEFEDVFYNANTSEIVWRIDKLAAGTGILQPAREVAFKVSLLAGPDQVGKFPVLITDSNFEGRDVFTDTILKDIKPSLNTFLESEPGFVQDDGKVVD